MTEDMISSILSAMLQVVVLGGVPLLALVVFLVPELWHILPIVFLGSLYQGWQRIKSGSILGAGMFSIIASRSGTQSPPVAV